MISWKTNLGLARIALATQIEYRFNFITEVLIQPTMTAFIEWMLWFSIFTYHGQSEIGGFDKNSYLSYAIWGAFIARITVNWNYETQMLTQIETGRVNTILVRPISFYYYYLVQFLSFKSLTTMISLMVPISLSYYLGLPFKLERLLPTLLLLGYFLILVHTISFCVSCLGFYVNRVFSFSVAKNIFLWLLSGELFPLDLLSPFWKNFLLNLPFCNAVYIPVGFLTGRIGIDLLLKGFLTTTLGLLLFGSVAAVLWKHSLKRYTGTGA